MVNVPEEKNDELKNQDVVEPITQPTSEEVAEVDSSEEVQPVEAGAELVSDPTSTEPEGEVASEDEFMSSPEEYEDKGESKTADDYDIPTTKEGVIERLQVLAEHPEQSEKVELDLLKQTFYKILKSDREFAFMQYIKSGGDAEAYVLQPEPLEEEFKKLFSVVKEQISKVIAAVEQQKEVNLTKKKAIIEHMKELASSPEEANRNYDAFRKLQEEWKSIKPIPAAAINETWKSFQFVVEQFYDFLKENNALRDYDFKKNLEAKTLLCEAAEKLAEDTDVIHAFHQLQQLHQEFREIGPVAKELREDLWARFKAASTVVNRMHSQYFDNLKKQEEENLAKKTAICERIESLDYSKLRGFSEWDRQSREIIAWQQEWRGIGRASRKTNNKIYERFRNACDKFFTSKSAYVKNQKRIFSDVADKKLQLCIQAEELKDSTDWSETTSKIIQLQNEWKELGFLPQKQSQKLWVRFNTACNYFFEQKKQVLGEQMKDEKANLAAKRDILKKLQEIAENITEESTEQVRALMEEWNSVGHVPFRDKDKINNQYRQLIDRLRLDLDLGSSRKGGKAKYHSGGADNAKGGARGNFLLRQYEAKKSELTTYENNITFLTAHSKSGNALIETMNKKIESLKEELAAIVERIKAQEQAAAEEAATETGPETQE